MLLPMATKKEERTRIYNIVVWPIPMVFSIFIALLKVLAPMIPVHTKKYGFKKKKIWLRPCYLYVKQTSMSTSIKAKPWNGGTNEN